MNIRIFEKTIELETLKTMAQEFYFPMIKGVIDIDTGIVAFGGEYHMDANTLLLSTYPNISQSTVWGFNLYLDKDKESWLEYTSLINIRPTAGNMNMEIESDEIRGKIKTILNKNILC